MGTRPYGMDYQDIAESALVGWKSLFVESGWWLHPYMETEKHNISTGTYCGYNCILWKWHYTFETLTGQMYRDQILRPLVVPHSDCHPLASRPILMDDNARPHRTCIVQDYLQQSYYLGQPCHRIWIQ